VQGPPQLYFLCRRSAIRAIGWSSLPRAPLLLTGTALAHRLSPALAGRSLWQVSEPMRRRRWLVVIASRGDAELG
jgi:hypothetical protein